MEGAGAAERGSVPFSGCSLVGFGSQTQECGSLQGCSQGKGLKVSVASLVYKHCGEGSPGLENVGCVARRPRQEGLWQLHLSFLPHALLGGGVGEPRPGAIVCMIQPSPPGQLLRRPFFPPLSGSTSTSLPLPLGHGFPAFRRVGPGVSILPVNPPRLRPPGSGSVPGWLWLPSPLTTNVGVATFVEASENLSLRPSQLPRAQGVGCPTSAGLGGGL